MTRLRFPGALAIAAAMAATAPAPGQGGPAAVVIDAVREDVVQEARKVTGELRALRRAMVATREGGIVKGLPVREGRLVKTGETLAVLDSLLLELETARAEADLQASLSLMEERRAEQTWRDRELELYKQSQERGAAGVKEILDAESAATVAAARFTQAERLRDVAKARIKLLERRLADMTIAAPFDGVVVSRQAELGEWVGEGEAIVELVSVGEIEAWIDVPQRFFDAVTSADLAISIQLDARDREIRAERLRIVPLMDPRARSFVLVATLDDNKGKLRPGMSLTAWIPTGTTGQRLTVSPDSILRSDAGAYVYVARGGGEGPAQAMPVNVKVLFPVGGRVVVEAPGLRPGDPVVVEGNERLFPMMPVVPMPAAAETGADAPR